MISNSEPSPLMAHPGIVNSMCKCSVFLEVTNRGMTSSSLLGLGVVYVY